MHIEPFKVWKPITASFHYEKGVRCVLTALHHCICAGNLQALPEPDQPLQF